MKITAAEVAKQVLLTLATAVIVASLLRRFPNLQKRIDEGF